MGLGRVELPTSRLSGVRSNQLSYRPVQAYIYDFENRIVGQAQDIDLGVNPGMLSKPPERVLLRMEVIQSQVPLRLPWYVFTPNTNHTVGVCLPEGLARRLLVQSAFVV